MRFFMALALLLVAADARAEPVHELTLGVTRFDYTAFFRTTATRYALDAGYHRSLGWGERQPLRVGGGLRFAGGGARGAPLEAYVSAQLQGGFGYWRPAVGPELGYSGYTQLTSDRAYRPPDIFDEEQHTVGPLYAGFSAAPLRFFVGPVVVSALELDVATTFTPAGATRRLQLGVLAVGGVL